MKKVWDSLDEGRKKALKQEVEKMLDFLAGTDKKMYGKISKGTKQAIKVQGYK